MQLLPVKGHCFLQQFVQRSGCQLTPQMSDTVAERELPGKLDKANHIAAAPTAVTVEQVLADIEVEGRARIPVQGTQSHKLLPGTGALRGPVVPPQVFQQRKTLFEQFQILFHALFFPLRSSVREKQPHSQARMVGGSIFSQPQGPIPGQEWKESPPVQRKRRMLENLSVTEPLAYGVNRAPQKRERRMGVIQASKPPPERGWIGYAIGILARRRGVFQRTVFQEVAL